MSMILRLISTIVALMAVPILGVAQSIKVSGIVTDEVTGEPLSLVFISTGLADVPDYRHYVTSTDKNGFYSVNVHPDAILYMHSDQNHHRIAVFVEGRSEIDVSMPVNHRDISEYEYVGEDRFGWRMVRLKGKYGFIDVNGVEVVHPKYDEICNDYPANFSMLRVRCGDGYGYVDYTGREVYPCVYENASLPYMVGCDLSRVKYDGKYGFVGIHGSILCIFENAEESLTYSYNPEYFEIDYSRGYAKVWDNEGGLVGYVNQNAELEGRLVYDDIIWNYYIDEPLWVRRYGHYFPAGTLSSEKAVRAYDYASSFNGQKYAVVGEIYRKGSGVMRYGYADKHGSVAIPLEYETAYPFSEGYAAVVKDGQLGFIDQKGTMAVPFRDYEYIGNFSDGLVAVFKKGRAGFIDAKGKTIIPFKYDIVHDFEEGTALVMLNGKVGLIDKKGKSLTKFIYDYVPDATDRLQLKRPDGSVVYLDSSGKEYSSLEERQKGLLQACLKKAESGSVNACYDVMCFYYQGRGTEVDLEKAKFWLFEGAKRGNLVCALLAGIYCYEDGDFAEAYRFFTSCHAELREDSRDLYTKRDALEKILNNARNAYLGKMHLYGNGVPQDYQKAVFYLAQSKFEDAPYLLAEMAERGLGMEVDLNKARELYDWYFRQTGYRYAWESTNRIERMLKSQSQGPILDADSPKYEEAKEESVETVSSLLLPQMKKLALVIGNSDYTYGNFLANPVNDAEDVSFKLEELGFDVILGRDLSKRDVLEKVDEFASRSAQYDVALFYYAGHGIQSEGANYLIPVDVNLKSETDIQYDCVNVSRVLSRLEEEDCKMKIIILDACRNNPFERSWSRSVDKKGLAMMDAPVGTFIAFSTAPGAVAKDGSGNNSPYADALLEVLDRPGLNIHDVFQDVHDIVVRNTEKEQHPWTSSSLTGRLYLNDKL